MRKTNGIFFVQWSFENLIFFQLPIKKVGYIMLILSKFQICGQLIVKYLNLWFTLLFVHFGKFCGPEKRPNFRIDLWVYIKKLDFGSTFLKVLSCIFLHVAPISSFNEININKFESVLAIGKYQK